MKPGAESTLEKLPGGAYYCRVHIILLISFVFFFFLGAGGVFAANTNESIGPDGCCWNQVYDGQTARLTGSADRLFYDWGYKPVEIYARQEEYWAKDCGWWYIGDTGTVSITLSDAAGNTVGTWNTIGTSKGRANRSYTWGSDDDPGKWSVTVTGSEGITQSDFYVYVRGKLNVTAISFNPTSPSTGQTVTINATLKDNTGRLINGSYTDNNGTSAPPTVTAYVTGAGEDYEVSLNDSNNDGYWTGTTPALSAMGDHKVKVKASDGHQYWVDGSGSDIISVTGSFPYASVLLSFLGRLAGGLVGDISPQSIYGALAALSGLAIGRRWYRG